MGSAGKVAIAFGVAAAALLLMLVAVAAGAITSSTVTGSGTSAARCHLSSDTDLELDLEQATNAVTIIQVGQQLDVPQRGWVIAIATAIQESGLRNLDRGDRDSLGLFQQRPSIGWGTPEQILDPTYAATAFYERLLQVPGWQNLPLTEAAQAVQRSAFPDAYAEHEAAAQRIVDAVASTNGWPVQDNVVPCVSIDGWTRPVAGQVTSGFRTASRPTHYGIDTADGRGSIVRAAAAGTVIVATCDATLGGQPYSCDMDGSPQVDGCGWYVDILHASDEPSPESSDAAVVTRYCHLQSRPEVRVGEQVRAGQPIGQVGTSGNSSGPHLHFEVELRTILSREADSIVIERRQTDPITFLATHGISLECLGTATNCEPVYGDRIRIER